MIRLYIGIELTAESLLLFGHKSDYFFFHYSSLFF